MHNRAFPYIYYSIIIRYVFLLHICRTRKSRISTKNGCYQINQRFHRDFIRMDLRKRMYHSAVDRHFVEIRYICWL